MTDNGRPTFAELIADDPDATEAVDRLNDVRDAKRIAYQVITSAELDSGNFELEYLIERTLVTGQPCVVAGQKKVLKTSLMIDLGVSLAVGGYFLGKLKCNREARVTIMSGESGLGTIQETARRIANAAGHQLNELDNLTWSTDMPRFGHLEHMDALGEMLSDQQTEVLIIDPAYLCMPSDNASNLMAQGELLRSMNDVAVACDAMLILAHHNRKRRSDQSDGLWQPPELEDIAWAGFQEWARQWLLIGRREAYEPGSNVHKLWLNVGGSAGHSALWAADIDENPTEEANAGRGWHVVLRSGRDERDEAKDRTERDRRRKSEIQEGDDKRKLWHVVQRHPEGETKTTLAEEAGLSGARAKRAAYLLAEEGRTEVVEITKGNARKYQAIRPKNPQPDSTGLQPDSHLNPVATHTTGLGTT